MLSTFYRLSCVVAAPDYAISRISRDEYLNIPTKTTQGRPTQYFVDRQITPVLKIWPLPDNSTDTILYDALTRVDDAGNYTYQYYRYSLPFYPL
jgi:hypothetical protein